MRHASRPFVVSLPGVLFASFGALVDTSPVAAQVWPPRNFLIGDPLTNQLNAGWGTSCVSGDFDNDGLSDLVCGAPLRDGPVSSDVGEVAVYRGSPAGLSPTYWVSHLHTWPDAQIGYAIAAGDFDNDGADELVYSAPGEQANSQDHAGRVKVWQYDDPTWSLDSDWYGLSGFPDLDEPFDRIGQALAVGDFNGDLRQDLAVGVPGENVGEPAAVLDAGAVGILYGSASGLVAAGAQYITEASGTLGGAQSNAHFGTSLAAGYFNDDNYADLAVGIPDRTVSGVAGAGEVVVLYGSATGLNTSASPPVHQRISDNEVAGGALGMNDHFGAALASGDFDLSLVCIVIDCFSDLAVGVPGEAEVAAGAGAVVIIEGSATGLNLATASSFHQGETGDNSSPPEAGDHFGAVLATGNVDGRVGTDLIVGVPDEDWDGDADQGIVHIIFGGPTGLLSYPGQYRLQDGFASGPGIAGDRFGATIAAGYFDGNLHGDLAIGVPGRNHGAIGNSGVVQVAYGALFADGFESGNTFGWSVDFP